MATFHPELVRVAEMDVDSVHAISLVGDVELHFDIDVDLTMIFDYPMPGRPRRIHRPRRRRAATGGISDPFQEITKRAAGHFRRPSTQTTWSPT